MKRRPNPFKVVALFLVAGIAGIAFAWGSYGHQQINNAAVRLMSRDNPLAACFLKNLRLITRYAITPDYEWKNVGGKIADPELSRKRSSNDRYEHPLHFFEPDAFIKDGKVTPESIAALPTGDYRSVFAQYQKMRTENEAYVTKIDPHKALKNAKQADVEEVTGHGTAPWRIRQLFDLGVKALKEGDQQKAMYYLGTMGHYVGDMSQPFHGSLNFDGDSHTPPASGIHSSFETKMLDEASKQFTGGKADPQTRLWKSFQATDADVIDQGKQARQAHDAGINPDGVVGEAIKLVGSGNAWVNPLLDAFATARRNNPSPSHPPKEAAPPSPASVAEVLPHPKTDDPEHGKDDEHAQKKQHHPAVSIPVGAIREFTKSTITSPETGKQVTVLKAATQRMGDGAALLARLWEAAYAQAKRENPDMPDISDCAETQFDLGYAINNYPIPSYLPHSTGGWGNGNGRGARPPAFQLPGTTPPAHDGR